MRTRRFVVRYLPGILVALVILALVGVAVGKYITTVDAGSGTVKVDARLAASLAVQESKAQRLASGEYTLDKSQTVAGNAYILMPGVDIPKDPRVIITGKTAIPAYLYLTLTCDNDALSYTLMAHWTPTEQANTYVYCDGEGNPVPITSTPAAIHVFENDTVCVSHELLNSDKPTDPIRITATLKEVTN